MRVRGAGDAGVNLGDKKTGKPKSHRTILIDQLARN